MARRKKEVLTLEQQIEAIDKEYSELQQKMKDLQKSKKELLLQMEEEKKNALYQAVMDSGHSISECIALIKGEESN